MTVPGTIKWRMAVLFAVILVCCFSFMTAQVSAEYISMGSDKPVEGHDVNNTFYVNTNITLNITHDDVPVIIKIFNESGIVVASDFRYILGGNASMGPYRFKEGDYTVNATFLVLEDGVYQPVFQEFEFYVIPEARGADMEPMQVVFTGIGVVFFILGFLALTTYVTGKVLKNRVTPPTCGGHGPIGDDRERIAAIAVAIRLRGD